jgi:hypothetical protein
LSGTHLCLFGISTCLSLVLTCISFLLLNNVSMFLIKVPPMGSTLALVCVFFVHLFSLCHRMLVLSYSPLHLLELVASHYRLLYHAYLREVGGNDSVLGGVDLETARTMPTYVRWATICWSFFGQPCRVLCNAHSRNRPCKPFASYNVCMGL